MAYSFVAAGTVSVDTGSPGQPAGKTAGHLLLCAAGQRANGAVNTAPTGWTLLYDTSSTANTSCALFGRIATNDASDDISGHAFFAGSSQEVSQIAAFAGGGYTDLSTIVVHSAAVGSTSNTANIPNPAITITTANCLVIGLGKKQKTVTADGVSATSPTGLSNRIGFSGTAGNACVLVWDYTIQTTATNIAASIWDQTPDESLPYASLIVALKSGVIGESIPPATLRLTSFAPTDQVNIKSESIPNGSLRLTGFAPSTFVTSHVYESIPVNTLTLTSFAPVISVHALEGIPVATLTLSSYAPVTNVVSLEEFRATGGGKKPTPSRVIIIGNKRYKIHSESELKYLLEQYLKEQQAKLRILEANATTPEAKKKIRLIKTNVTKTIKRIEEIYDEEEELLMLL